MGFLSNLFGQRPADTAGKPDLALYEKIVDCTAVTEVLKSDLKRKLRRAFTDPKAFYSPDNTFTLMPDRGLTYPEDSLQTPRFVLLDTLQEANQLAEVDWKEEEEEIREAVNTILTAKNYGHSISDYNQYSDLTATLEIINQINQLELQPRGYCLELLDTGTDSYVFTILPADQQQKVVALFAQFK